MVFKSTLYGGEMKKNIKILIVDNEALVAVNIKNALIKMGYNSVSIATTYDKAIEFIETEKLDLILLDINLNSEQDGIDLANEKKVLNKIPIIYITGYSQQQVMEELLATNPQNCLTKPIRYEELEMNIAIALNHNKEVIELGYDFTYDLENGNLFMKDIYIKLSNNEKHLLERLLEDQGKAVPFSTLEFAVWGNETMSDNSLRALISKLKQKLIPEMIVNVLGLGYTLKSIEEK
jgi:DNA-binding response OmpR family regulator